MAFVCFACVLLVCVAAFACLFLFYACFCLFCLLVVYFFAWLLLFALLACFACFGCLSLLALVCFACLFCGCGGGDCEKISKKEGHDRRKSKPPPSFSCQRVTKWLYFRVMEFSILSTLKVSKNPNLWKVFLILFSYWSHFHKAWDHFLLAWLLTFSSITASSNYISSNGFNYLTKTGSWTVNCTVWRVVQFCVAISLFHCSGWVEIAKPDIPENLYPTCILWLVAPLRGHTFISRVILEIDDVSG